MEDALSSTDVEISKVVAGGGPELPGAKITLTGVYPSGDVIRFNDSNIAGTNAVLGKGNESISYTSTDSSTIIKGIPDGTYTLHEDAAPDGYRVSTDIEFKVSGGKVTGTTVTSSSNAAELQIIQFCSERRQVIHILIIH